MSVVESRAKAGEPLTPASQQYVACDKKNRPETRSFAILMLAIFVALGLALRWLALFVHQIWFDEAVWWRAAGLPGNTFRSALLYDSHPPLFLIVLRYWLPIWGESTVALRSLSLLSGLVIILGSYLLVKDACLLLAPQKDLAAASGEARRIGLFTALLVTLSPFQILYSVEARNYALGGALALGSSWLLLRALAADRRICWRWWLAYAAVTILFTYTHYFALFTIACQGFFVVWRLCEKENGRWWLLPRRPAFLLACLGFGLVGVGFSPWLPIMYRQVTQGAETRAWLPPLTSGWQILEIVAKLVGDPEARLSPSGTARIAFVLFSFLAIAIYRGREVDWFFLCLGIGPLLLMTAAALAGIRLLHPRYLAFAQPFLLATIALTALRGRSLARIVFMGFFLLTASAWTCADAWVWPEWASKPGYRGVARYLAEHRREGEPVLVANGFIFLPLLFYAPDRTDFHVVPPEPGHYVPGQITLKEEEIPQGDYFADWAGRKIWVVNTNGLGGLPNQVMVPDSWQAKERNAFQESSGAVIEVIRYDPSTP